MHRFLKVFFWGLLISFLGSLPMGTLNITAMQISIQETVQFAYYFSIGVVLVEIVYVRFSLVGINWVRKQRRVMKAMEWITLAIVLALAAGSFIAAMRENPDAKNVVLQNNMHRFVLGIMMSALNPVQIPFWFGWSTVLFSKGVLQPVRKQYNIYILGIGLGTLIAHTLFIFGGKLLVNKLNASQTYLNWVIGGIFTFTAIVYLIKILMRRDALKKVDDIKEEDILPNPID
ncbi:MAG: LysE family transporter [Ferruginibacter sp.]|nr:LysE family transporter [Ferruginibacter sp.]